MFHVLQLGGGGGGPSRGLRSSSTRGAKVTFIKENFKVLINAKPEAAAFSFLSNDCLLDD